MKKFGFTLMEIIVALGIVGVVAAISAPILNNLIPDKEKLAVLKTYKIITDINNEIKEDKSVWQEAQDAANQGMGWSGVLTNGNDYPNLVFAQLNTVPDSRRNTARGIEFDTTNGIHWIVEDPDGGYGTITVDLMNEKREHCTYNSGSCRKPGRFRFLVDASTLNIKPGDPLTAAYLANPNKLSDKKTDYQTAKANNPSKYNEY